MPPRRRRACRARITQPLAVAVVAAIVVGGCAAKPKPKPSDAPPILPIETVGLADVLPPVALSAPATQPATPASTEALQLYAAGRDALLTNRKQAAIEKLQAAAELEPTSAIIHRDLGYALLGNDNARAGAALRQAIALDPTDADARVQLARILANATPKREAEAIIQLRLARLSPSYADSDGLSAVVDLLLGRLLEQKGYRVAALECYEHMLDTLDHGSIQLRGRPELAELLQRPGVLTLQIADLAVQAKQPDRAIELYELLQKQEPQAAAMLELRIARAHMDAGRIDEATVRGFNVVETFRANRSARAAFAKLFERVGYDRALTEIDRLKTTGQNTSTLDILRADLHLRAGRPGQAIEVINRVDRFDLSAARLTVQAYRAAGKPDALLVELIERTAKFPKRWPAINRAWAMLTHQAQASPLTARAIDAAKIPPENEAARQFVLAQLWNDRGQPMPARRAMAQAQTLNPQLVAALLQTPESDIDLNADFADESDLVELVFDYRDDPQLLNVATATIVRQGQKQQLLSALQKANAQRPADGVIAGTYAQLLALDEQKPEALEALERAVQQSMSANELYMLANQYSLLGDLKTSEQVLRKALKVDPENTSVCNDLGYVLVDQGRDLDDAESLLWKAVGAELENPVYLDSLGWLLYKRGRFGEASQYLEQAVNASEPSDPVVLDHAADALQRLDKTDQAKQRWTQAVDAIKQRGTSDPQLRLRIEQKLRQLNEKQQVDVAPVAQ